MRLILADCVEAMGELDEASVDAIVCDPPYGLEFMGKEWDSFRVDDPGTNRHRGEYAGNHGELKAEADIAAAGRVAYGGGKRAATYRCTGCGKRDQFRNPHACGDARWARELIDPHSAPPTLLAFQEWSRFWALAAKRVLKPGGHLLAFGGTRTYHRLACAVEDAGFEIRDCIAFMYGSGFPKSLNLNGDHSGWGTALKPAYEPIVVARKPLIGTVAQNVERYGTGAVNVDGCRVDWRDESDRAAAAAAAGFGASMERGTVGEPTSLPTRYDPETKRRYVAGLAEQTGRWPANVLLDEQAADMLDEQTGVLVSGPESDKGRRRNADSEARRNAYGGFQGQTATGVLYGDSGGASRFFYTAKASRAERNAGLEGFAEKVAGGMQARQGGSLDGGIVYARNVHPTVKPIALMRWLCRLVTPPGGTVLDPFMGSGTTGIAAALEGFDFIGIEREPEYHAIAEARIAFWQEHGEKALLAMYEAERRREVAETGQLAMEWA